MKLTPGQHIVIHTTHLRADTVRALVLGALMGVCGLAWGWNLFHSTLWMEARYWSFGTYICGGRLVAAASLADNYFIYRCADGSEHKKRVLLTRDWKGL